MEYYGKIIVVLQRHFPVKLQILTSLYERSDNFTLKDIIHYSKYMNIE